jgi:hypothetical protein
MPYNCVPHGLKNSELTSFIEIEIDGRGIMMNCGDDWDGACFMLSPQESRHLAAVLIAMADAADKIEKIDDPSLKL